MAENCSTALLLHCFCTAAMFDGREHHSCILWRQSLCEKKKKYSCAFLIIIPTTPISMVNRSTRSQRVEAPLHIQ